MGGSVGGVDWNTYEAAQQGAFDGPVFFWGVVIVAGVLSCIMFYLAMKEGVFKAIFKTICALFKTEVCLNCKYVIPKKHKRMP